MSSVSRGGALPVVKIEPNEPFGLYLDIPPQSGISAFQFEVRSGSQPKFAIGFRRSRRAIPFIC